MRNPFIGPLSAVQIHELLYGFVTMGIIIVVLIAYVWTTVQLVLKVRNITDELVERFRSVFKVAGYVGIFHASMGIILASSAQTIIFALVALVLVMIGALYLHISTIAYNKVQELQKAPSTHG